MSLTSMTRKEKPLKATLNSSSRDTQKGLAVERCEEKQRNRRIGNTPDRSAQTFLLSFASF